MPGVHRLGEWRGGRRQPRSPRSGSSSGNGQASGGTRWPAPHGALELRSARPVSSCWSSRRPYPSRRGGPGPPRTGSPGRWNQGVSPGFLLAARSKLGRSARTQHRKRRPRHEHPVLHPGPAGYQPAGHRPPRLATPGHHEAAVTHYDRYSGLLLTGDTIYPGRLYVLDWPGFVRSIDRLAGWCARRPVTHLLGCHIEMTTTPGADYPAGWSYQPDEPPLQLTTEHLRQVQATLKAHNLQPGRYVLPQMIITPAG